MGYYAVYGGAIKFKEKPSDGVLESLDYMFENLNYDKESMTADFGGEETNYYDDEVLDALNDVKDIIESGEIEWSGEDFCHWRHLFKDGRWVSENASIIYESEPALQLSKQEETEFIGQFIDIIEDYIHPDAKPSDKQIDGEDYNKLAAQIRSLLHNWNVL